MMLESLKTDIDCCEAMMHFTFAMSQSAPVMTGYLPVYVPWSALTTPSAIVSFGQSTASIVVPSE